MELLHNSGLSDVDTWVECLETVQEKLSKHTTDEVRFYPKPENVIPNQIQNQPWVNHLPMEIKTPFGKPKPSQAKWSLDSTLAELALHNESIDLNCQAIKLVNIFKSNPLLPGIIITEEGKFLGMISRRHFFEQMSRPYSWRLFAQRPIIALYQVAKNEILMLKSDTTIVAAAKQSLERSPDLLYEPIVIRDDGENFQLLDVHQLFLAQSRVHDEVSQALQQAEFKYRSIFENAAEGIFQSTPDGTYISVNPALAKLYGYDSPAELIENITNIETQLYVDSERRLELISRLQKYDVVLKFESRIYRKDGTIIWISENTRAIRDANGKLVYYEGTAEDVTERKRSEEALRQSEARYKQQAAELEETLQELRRTQSQLIQSEKMSNLGQLVAGVAHEINNPVSCIYGNLPHANGYIQDLLHLLQLYIKHYPQPHQEIQQLTNDIDLEFAIDDLPLVMSAMHQGAERIRQIVLSLRNFSRLDEKQMQTVQIHEGIDSTLLILQHRLKPKKEMPAIRVIKEYGHLPLVKCYPGQLNQVFMNLLGNAIDALEMSDRQWKTANSENQELPRPTIWIRTKVVNNYARIVIADNGSGMTEEVRQNLFQPFFTTKPLGKGTGLGLSIGYQIVTEKHKGKLSCNSSPGKGAEFAIEIPI